MTATGNNKLLKNMKWNREKEFLEDLYCLYSYPSKHFRNVLFLNNFNLLKI